MYPSPSSSRVHPKISTMPRHRSESSNYLDLYKLAIEKKRLKQELASMERRRSQIQSRLHILEQHINHLELSARHSRESASASVPNSMIYPPMQSSDTQDTVSFQTVTLDY